MKPNQNTINKSGTTLSDSKNTPERQLKTEQLLNTVNKQKKDIVNLRNLELEKPYQIYGWERINTKKPYARSVVVLDLGEFKVWGNTKCSSWSDETLKGLVESQVKLIYRGLKDNQHNLLFTQ